MWKMCSVFLSLVSALWLWTGGVLGDPDLRTCEPITIDLCRHIGYNITGMPNLVGHDLQQDANEQLQTFKPLIMYNCSSQLNFFLCSVYAPMCTEKVRKPIGPCQPICHNVRRRCEPVLLEFGFAWPAVLNCSKFPVRNDQDHMCMEGPDPAPGDNVPAKGRPLPPGPLRPRPPSQGGVPSARSCAMYRNPELFVYVNRSERCAQRCQADNLFTSGNKDFTELWMKIWASLCIVSCLFTFCTFLVDSSRFRYPERPMVMLSLCYFFISAGYITRLVVGREGVACGPAYPEGPPILLLQGLENTGCSIVFLLIYYFSAASSVWWVILTLTWFLTAGLKWGHEAIARYSQYLHLVAWAVPAIKTIVIFVIHKVDADELTGLCHVGNFHDPSLLAFVIVPLLAYMLIGTSFLVAGFVALFRIRSQVRSEGQQTDKLEKLMLRIGTFSVLYTVPAACVIGCYLYEYVQRKYWYSPHSELKPVFVVFQVKICMSLVIGTTSGMWIWSTKTVTSWRNFGRRLCGISQPSKNPKYPQYQYHSHPQQPPPYGQTPPPHYIPGKQVAITRTVHMTEPRRLIGTDGTTVV